MGNDPGLTDIIGDSRRSKVFAFVLGQVKGLLEQQPGINQIRLCIDHCHCIQLGKLKVISTPTLFNDLVNLFDQRL